MSVSARNLDYYSEFIDLTRFPEPAYKEGFRDFLRLKYQGVRFDLVIAMQDRPSSSSTSTATPCFATHRSCS